MLDAPPVNTIGYGKAAALAAYPLWSILQAEVNGGWSNYHAFTVSASKRFSQGLQFLTTYTFAKNLSSAQSYNPTGFASEAGGLATDLKNIGLDYGAVAYTRKNRFLSPFLYELPFRHGGKFLKGANDVR